MEISKKEKERILKLHESYRDWDGSLINEQGYQPQGDGRGGTSTSSSGQYTSAGAWDQKGPFFKTRRKAPETEVKEVDITGGGGNTYKGYTKGLSIDQIPTDNQSPGNNIESTDDIGPQYSIVNTQDNGYRNPYDNDNPDPYDRQRPDPKKGTSEKEWRSPPCCRPCGGGKWKRDCGELERAPGSKKSKSTGCVYNSYSDCQLAGKSINEHNIGHGSGFVDNQGSSASLAKFNRRQQEMGEQYDEEDAKFDEKVFLQKFNAVKSIINNKGKVITKDQRKKYRKTLKDFYEYMSSLGLGYYGLYKVKNASGEIIGSKEQRRQAQQTRDTMYEQTIGDNPVLMGDETDAAQARIKQLQNGIEKWDIKIRPTSPSGSFKKLQHLNRLLDKANDFLINDLGVGG